jgi:hypothetical protein
MRATSMLILVALTACEGDGMSKYPPPITDPSPSVYVSDLPPGNSKVRDTVSSTAHSFNNSGRYGGLVGGINVKVIEDDRWGEVANLEIAVEEGRIRAYIKDGDGYRYIEATPDNPARIKGPLIWMAGWLVFRLQSVEGEAIGAAYHVWRDPLEGKRKK